MTQRPNEAAAWADVERWFAGALDLAPSARAAFLEQIADAAVRREVQSLLAHADTDGRFIESAIGSVADQLVAEAEASQPTAVAAGRRIGPYEISGIIGQGGMGAVYRARRADGQFEQDVAIKLVRTGFESAALLERFRQERQILARLTHVSIARLLDGGTATGDDGTAMPYLVMEYVEGVPITSYCATRALPVPELIALFRRVCAAVQYAHQQLIVHRDLKPSNILVTASGEPVLLDFGIARLLTDDAADQSLTQAGMPMLTPEYASPEQVRGDAATAATDIYALGTLLYEMLTGRKAHQFHTLSPAELTRVVGTLEPTRPSAAVPDAFPGAARRRRQLTGDLDTIVMKALRKAPERRYPSVEQFSEDLRRYLEGLPVQARADSVGYRTRKFVTRHAWLVGAAALVTISLVAGTVVSVWQARRAERRFQQVQRLARTLMYDVHDEIRQLPGSTAARQTIVTTALDYLRGLEAEAGGDPALERDIAAAFMRVGEVQGDMLGSNLGQAQAALASFERARELYDRHDAPDRLRNVARAELKIGATLGYTGNTAGALAAYERARARLEPLASRDGAAPEDLAQLANTYIALSQIHVRMGQNTEALTRSERAVDVSRRLLARDPGREEWSASTADALTRMSDALHRIGRLQEALPFAREALALREASVAAAPANTSALRSLMLAYSHLGDLVGNPTMPSLGDLSGAVEQYRKMTAIAEQLVATDAADKRARWDLANCLLRLGSLLIVVPDARDGVDQLERASRLLRDITDTEPRNTRAATMLALTEMRLGDAVGAASRAEPALRHYDEAVRTATAVLALDRDEASAQAIQADVLGHRAELLARAGRREEALGDARSSIAIREQRAAVIQSNATFAGLGEMYAFVGRLAYESARTDERTTACGWLEKSAAAYARAGAIAPLDSKMAAAAERVRRDVQDCRAR